MDSKDRYLAGPIRDALARKMAFVGGPRQVGKTTLALSLLGSRADESHPAYFNWDDPRDAARLRRVELLPDEKLLVFDEIHKYARWRGLVKGIHDSEKSSRRILVAGSARLDDYRKGGDSLANRYRYFAERTPIPRFFQVHLGEAHYESGKATVLPFSRFCRDRGLP